MLRTTLRMTALSAAAFALVAPLTQAEVALAEEPAAPAALVDTAATASFDTAFATVPAPAAEPVAIPEHAVDLETIEPPIEAAPAATAIAGGRASYYGRRFHGRRTASGEAFNMNDMTAAHRTLPFGTRVRVTNTRTGASVIVRINDRGPFHGNRVIDVSRAAAGELGLIRSGTGTVTLEVLD